MITKDELAGMNAWDAAVARKSNRAEAGRKAGKTRAATREAARVQAIKDDFAAELASAARFSRLVSSVVARPRRNGGQARVFAVSSLGGGLGVGDELLRRGAHLGER